MQWSTANNFFKIPQEIHRKRPGNAEFPVEFSEPSNFGIFHASENFTGNIVFPDTENSTGNIAFSVDIQVQYTSKWDRSFVHFFVLFLAIGSFFLRFSLLLAYLIWVILHLIHDLLKKTWFMVYNFLYWVLIIIIIIIMVLLQQLLLLRH